jgi:hypothetical protein
MNAIIKIFEETGVKAATEPSSSNPLQSTLTPLPWCPTGLHLGAGVPGAGDGGEVPQERHPCREHRGQALQPAGGVLRSCPLPR